MDAARARGFIDQCWEDAILPSLIDYIKIPNKSPSFDPKWAEHGYMDAAVRLMEQWAKEKITDFKGASLDVVRLPGRTPVILMEIPGEGAETVLLYGHLDKQPEMVGWSEGLGPWKPVRRGDKLFGRGGADDGYAMYASLAALLALRDQQLLHARCVILIEACEESGSYDLPYYVDHLASRIGKPSLVICLDSGCGDYERLWLTTSLRGMCTGLLTVRVLEEGVHSGDASGVVPSCVRILRQVISRLEDETSGAIKPAELYAQVPQQRIEQGKEAARILGDTVYTKFPFITGTKPVAEDPTELVLNRTWRPQLAVTGISGIPEPENAGNVMLPFATAKLSLRLPPTVDAQKADEVVTRLLQSDPPYGCQVTFHAERGTTGWNAPALSPWLTKSVADASQGAFGQPPAYMGEGGTIPFMAMLGRKFPEAQFLITGVLGPHSNAHGPNEFLHIAYAKKLTACVADVLSAHAGR